MAAIYNRQFTGGEDGIGQSGEYGAAVWIVTGVSSGREARTDPNVPIKFNDPHPDAPGQPLRCDNIRVSTISPSCYRLTATFSSPANGGSTYTDPVTNPLSEPAEYRIDPVQMSLPVERDSDGNFITVSSGRGFDPPQHKDYAAFELVITRNEAHYSIPTALQYINTVNVSAWAGAKAGEVRCVGIAPASSFKDGASYVAIEYRFLFLPESLFGANPHQLRVLDQDTMAVRELTDGGPKGLVQLIDFNGDAVDGPILLDGMGKPLDAWITYRDSIDRIVQAPQFVGQTPAGATVETSPTGAVFLRYDKTYPAINFAALGLPV